MSSAAFVSNYLAEASRILADLCAPEIDAVAKSLESVRELGGRVFVLGVGGSAATASHTVNDLRKLCSIEAYAPTDNVAELTARTNDDGWDSAFTGWLRGSHLSRRDGVLVISVGGGTDAISNGLSRALEYADSVEARIMGVVGRDGGATKRLASSCVLVPPLYPERVTPHTEGLASVVLHCLVTHPILARNPTKW